MFKDYYFVGTLIPELEMGIKPDISFAEYDEILKENLSEEDYSQVEHLKELLKVVNFETRLEPKKGFIGRFYEQEKESRAFLASLRAKKWGREQEVPAVAIADLAKLFETYQDDPDALYKALLEYRFKMIENLYGLKAFTLDRLLAYMAELYMVEKSVK